MKENNDSTKAQTVELLLRVRMQVTRTNSSDQERERERELNELCDLLALSSLELID